MKVMTGIVNNILIFFKTMFFSKGTVRPLPPAHDKDGSSRGQALTEYTLILTVLFPIGVLVSTFFVSFDNIQVVIFDYYISIADFLNLPFF